MLSDNCQLIQKSLTAAKLEISNLSNDSDSGIKAGMDQASNGLIIDYEPLVQIRREHETEQAKKGTRKLSANDNSDTDTMEERNLVDSPRENINAQLMKMFQDILRKDEEDRSISTGASQRLRWTGTNPGYTATSGNSANATEVASANAKRVN